MDGRPTRTRKPKQTPQAAAESDEQPSYVDPADLAELESLAGSPGQFDLSSVADSSAAKQAGEVKEPAGGEPKPGRYKMDQKLIKESLSIAYSFVLTIADKGSKGVVPGNRMNDIIATRPGYQKRLDNLLMAIAEEYGCAEYIPTPVALLLFTASVYAEASSQSSTLTSASPSQNTSSSSSAAPRTLS